VIKIYKVFKNNNNKNRKMIFKIKNIKFLHLRSLNNIKLSLMLNQARMIQIQKLHQLGPTFHQIYKDTISFLQNLISLLKKKILKFYKMKMVKICKEKILRILELKASIILFFNAVLNNLGLNIIPRCS
jgi:hypothetical protein